MAITNHFRKATKSVVQQSVFCLLFLAGEHLSIWSVAGPSGQGAHWLSATPRSLRPRTARPPTLPAMGTKTPARLRQRDVLPDSCSFVVAVRTKFTVWRPPRPRAGGGLQARFISPPPGRVASQQPREGSGRPATRQAAPSHFMRRAMAERDSTYDCAS